MSSEEIDGILCQVRDWLTEEERNDGRYAWCRAAKLELLMNRGFVTQDEADDCWALSAQHSTKGAE